MRFLSLLPLAALVFGACSAPAARPAAAEEGDPTASLEASLAAQGVYPEELPTRVTLLDTRSGVKVGLLNEATSSKAEFYSVQRRDAAYKVVPNLDMGVLLAALEEIGFFDHARPGAERVRGATVMLQVERDGSTWTLGYNPHDPADLIRCGVECKETVRAFYNRTTAFQSVASDEGALLFLRSVQNARKR